MLKKISKNIWRRIAKTLAATMVIGCPLSVSAMEDVPIGWSGKQIFDVQYYGTEDYSEQLENFLKSRDADSGDFNYFTYTLPVAIADGLNKAFLWWSEIIAPGAVINQPAQYFVTTADEVNASATSISLLNEIETRNPNLFSDIFQNGRVVPYFNDLNALADDTFSPEKAYALIFIGKNLGINDNGQYGWTNTSYYAFPLPQAMKYLDISSVMFHEIGHSLGISANRVDNPYEFVYADYLSPRVWGDAASNPNSYTSHLRNADGEAPRQGQMILWPELLDRERFPTEYLAATGKEVSAEDFFLVEDIGGLVGRNGRVVLYFTGDNVTEALGGKTFTTVTGRQVSGIPINGWEDFIPDFSHSELARSMMSHQRYRNYVTFMEAELAMLQDMGYDIDRKNFYGRSIYSDNQTLINDQIFSARANGQYVNGYNTSTFGVGLHVYGSYNDITQRGNIWTAGSGAVGIRVDGLGNKVTVPLGTEIHSDGTLGTGVLIAYGRNHNVTIDGTVTANGSEGNAVHFEFGANSLGATTEYRGSYIRYTRSLNDGQIIGAKNYGLNEILYSSDDYSITDLVNGDLNAPMGSLTVNGKLESKNGNAIYIAEESFVDRIDINKGAQIFGNIESVWKQFDLDNYGIPATAQTFTYQDEVKDNDGNVTGYETRTGEIEPLYIQYNGGKYTYNQYIPDLVTQLNFNAADGEIFYNGDIRGFDNMKINVTGGTLYYGGTANVVSVNVAGGARVFGGIYSVNDMTARMADGFSDLTTGKFINHGTIGALSINGNLLSDGVLWGDSSTKINVYGSAYVEGSTATADNLLPGDMTAILTATNGVTGTLKNSLTPLALTPLMSARGSIANNSVIVTAEPTNNLGDLNRRQAQSFDAASDMSKTLLNDSRREQLRQLFYADDATARTMLEQMGTSPASEMMSYAQQNSRVSRLLTDRFSGKNFSDDIWVKFTKDWGKLYGGDKFHGQTISVGWDKDFGSNWRGGLFVSYEASNLDRGEVKDTRGGIYGNWNIGADSALIYFDAGQLRNKFSRNLGSFGLGTSAKYHGTIFEFGGEYKRDLTPDENFHISPFINLQVSHLRQNAFNESGAGIYNHHVHSKRNTYFAGQLGLEYRKNFSRGNIAARLGVQHAFSGAQPELNFHYEGGTNSYRLSNRQDKTHFVLSLNGEYEFAKDWTFGGEIFLQKGSHDRDLSASLFLRKMW